MNTTCFHGGAFWEEIGPKFDDLTRKNAVINADVLDAWFTPAPAVREALTNWEWIASTSPPTHSEGLRRIVADTNEIREDSILCGPGSSSLIYLALNHWLTKPSRVLLIEPSYGEYAHLCDKVIGCRVDRLVLREEDGFRCDLDQWVEILNQNRYDLAVFVNPNNPCGHAHNKLDLGRAIDRIPAHTRVLIDEAYVDFAGRRFSSQGIASARENVAVVKSLSKGLALSGLRVAYLVAHHHSIAELARWSPPWAVSLPGQIAAVLAIKDPGYYHGKYANTQALRTELASGLENLGFRTFGSTGNWVLCRVPEGQSAHMIAEGLRSKGLFIRDAGASAPSLGDEFVRIAVKDGVLQDRMIELIGEARAADSLDRQEGRASKISRV